MKKLVSLMLALCLVMCAFACADEDLLSRITSKGVIVVASEGCWAPWTYHDEVTDEAIGFDMDVVRAVAAKLGVEVQFVDCPWDSLFGGLDSGRYDLIANGVEWTEDRAEAISMSDAYAYMRTALIVRGDNEEIKGFEDLNGKKTTNTISSTYAAIGESYGATVVGVDDLNSTMMLVMQGRVDATLNAEVSYVEYMTEHPEANLKVVATTEEASLVCMCVRKGEDTESFVAAINQALAELNEEGVLTEISIKYFGRDITK